MPELTITQQRININTTQNLPENYKPQKINYLHWVIQVNKGKGINQIKYN